MRLLKSVMLAAKDAMFVPLLMNVQNVSYLKIGSMMVIKDVYAEMHSLKVVNLANPACMDVSYVPKLPAVQLVILPIILNQMQIICAYVIAILCILIKMFANTVAKPSLIAAHAQMLIIANNVFLHF